MSDIDALSEIVEDIGIRLEDKDTVRELALKSSRTIERLSRQIIQDIHSGNGSREKFNEALQEASKVKSIVEDYPELYHSGFLRNGFQELAEAHILWSISRDEYPLNPHELDITPSSYLIGLGDAVGELRRMILDSLIAGDVDRAMEFMVKMERIKDMLMEFDFPNAIVPIKTKQDIARDLVEKTRGDIATYLNNEKLRKKMDELMEQL
ncbi:MAG: translin family protein [Thermoplasmata archaeon]